jgi:hypothetical protein
VGSAALFSGCAGQLGWLGSSTWDYSALVAPALLKQAMIVFRALNENLVKVRILRGFLENEELCLGGSQPLRLQQQVVQIAIARPRVGAL